MNHTNLLALVSDPKSLSDFLTTTIFPSLSTSDQPIATFLTLASSEAMGLVNTRIIFTEFISLFASHSQSQSQSQQSHHLGVWKRVVDQLSERGLAFEEQISAAREAWADVLETGEKWSEAAAVLKGIPLDSGTRNVPDDYKVKIYIRIVRLYLEEEDSVSADAYLNRAAMLNPQDKLMQIHLMASQARSLDFKRQFVQATVKYLELSYKAELHDSERISALIAAVTCAILAGAGPQRSRILKTLYKDERVRERPEVKKDGVFAILEKMYLGTLVKREHVAEFASKLLPHQLALLSDGVTTVLDKAINEHNLLAASRLYLNIRFEELGLVLGVSGEEAEVMAGRMIEEGRLKGKIDQIDRLVYFSQEGGVNGDWDASIGGVCKELDDIVLRILSKYPELNNASPLR